MTLVAIATATATAPPGSIHLAAYPGLTYAPAQHGPGIRFAHNGRPVDEVAASESGRAAAIRIEHIAAALGVSFADACDALKYLHDQKRI
jgi:hypothetical protein